VQLLRWKAKYDQIPENTKDPGLLKARKSLKKKKPKRSETIQYWTEGMFERLKTAPAGKLYSKGPLPWRLLAYLLKISPEVERVRRVLRKRLMDAPRIAAQEKQLERMLVTLSEGGFVVLDPPPVIKKGTGTISAAADAAKPDAVPAEMVPVPFLTATPTPKLDTLLVFRSVHPLFAAFLLDHLGIADRTERLQAFESVLELPRPILKFVRPPWPDELPPGPLAATRLDNELIQRGLIAAPVPPAADDEEEDDDDRFRERPPSLSEKLFLLYEGALPGRGRHAGTAGVGGQRAAARLRRQLQPLRQEPRPDQAGGADLPPPAAADPAVRRVRPGHAGGHDGRGVADRFARDCRNG